MEHYPKHSKESGSLHKKLEFQLLLEIVFWSSKSWPGTCFWLPPYTWWGEGTESKGRMLMYLDLFSWSECRPWEPWDVNHRNCEQKLKILWRTLWCISDVTTWSTKTTVWLSSLTGVLQYLKTELPWNDTHFQEPWACTNTSKQQGGAQGINFLSIPQGLYGGVKMSMREKQLFFSLT